MKSLPQGVDPGQATDQLPAAAPHQHFLLDGIIPHWKHIAANIIVQGTNPNFLTFRAYKLGA